MGIIDVLGTDKNIIPYRPELRKIAGSVNATILLQQIIYYCAGKQDGKFYKFRTPCEHPNYRVGDSWTEKLGFSGKEFDCALDNIAYKQGKSQNKLSKEDALVYYHTDKERNTWYCLNTDRLEYLLATVYNNIAKKEEILPNSPKVDYLVIDQKGITNKLTKEELLGNSPKGNYKVIDQKGITIHTEINYKEDLHRGVCEKDFEISNPASKFQNEIVELNDFFKGDPKNPQNLPAKTEIDTKVAKEEKSVVKAQKTAKFQVPTLEEVLGFLSEYFAQKNITKYNTEKVANQFFDHYASNGWLVGKAKAPMRDWHASLRGWVGRIEDFTPAKNAKTAQPQERKVFSGVLTE